MLFLVLVLMKSPGYYPVLAGCLLIEAGLFAVLAVRHGSLNKHQLIRLFPEAILLLDKDGKVKAANERAALLFGYAAKELTGASVELVLPQLPPACYRELKTHYAGLPGSGLLAIRKNGRSFTASVHFSSIAVKHTKQLLLSVRDSSVNAEDTKAMLLKMEDHYHQMIAEVEDYAILFLDQDGTVKSWNRGAEKIKGYTAADIIGKNFRLFYPEADQAAMLPEKLLAEAALQGKAVHEGWRLRKDGSAFWGSVLITAIHDHESRLTGFTKVTKDLTAAKKSEDKFRALLNSAPDATVIVNESGIIEMMNDQTEQLFGYTREELIGKTVELLIPHELAEKHAAHRLNFMQSARVRTMGEGIVLNAVKKNGQHFPVEISLSPLQTDEGLLVSAAVRDISRRRMLEQDLRQSHAEMESFTYSVSHDLRAPLRNIVGFTSILEEEYTNQLDDEAKRLTGIIRSNTLKMGRLVDDLLEFARMRKQDLVKTHIDSNAMVTAVLADLKPQTAALSIEWHIADLLPANADRNMLRQVWINLLSNAVKYSQHSPLIQIQVRSSVQDGQTVFSVKDNGVGFNEKYKHKLFNVFQRLHSPEQFEGTGVGLALVEKIVSRHGGRVWASGKENEGACFYFSLPV